MRIALGLAMRDVSDFDFAEMRLYGVLQRIGLVYLAVGILYLWTSERTRVAWIGVLLLAYWGLLMLIPVPGYGLGDLSPDGNLAAYIDRLLLPGRLYAGSWDPDGTETEGQVERVRDLSPPRTGPRVSPAPQAAWRGADRRGRERGSHHSPGARPQEESR